MDKSTDCFTICLQWYIEVKIWCQFGVYGWLGYPEADRRSLQTVSQNSCPTEFTVQVCLHRQSRCVWIHGPLQCLQCDQSSDTHNGVCIPRLTHISSLSCSLGTAPALLYDTPPAPSIVSSRQFPAIFLHKALTVGTVALHRHHSLAVLSLSTFCPCLRCSCGVIQNNTEFFTVILLHHQSTVYIVQRSCANWAEDKNTSCTQNIATPHHRKDSTPPWS